jgi:hypothetical protein
LAAAQEPLEKWLKNNKILTMYSYTHERRLEMLISGSSFGTDPTAMALELLLGRASSRVPDLDGAVI